MSEIVKPYVLIFFVWVAPLNADGGLLARPADVSVTSERFASQAICEEAAKAAIAALPAKSFQTRYACVPAE
ncbi:MAG: hypothetical protein HXY22_00815 [Alphaproteobacteria bacterium]|nr:hypothetical protein [Alphaproteobacteria bacterium]